MPEVLLWNCICAGAPDGVIFRRQHSLSDKITVDFYCANARLCIEIDGIAHAMGDQPERDDARDAFVKELGMEVMRIPATDVLKSPEDVAEMLVRYCKR